MVRYADDAVLCFEHESDALRVLAVLPKRFARLGLELNVDKTQRVDFRRPRLRNVEHKGAGTGLHGFDVLGFTHYWGRSRKGRWIVTRKTAKSRFSRVLVRVAKWCRSNRHLPVREQCKALRRRLMGHDAYFGITGNGPALSPFHFEVERGWRKWLAVGARLNAGNGIRACGQRFVRTNHHSRSEIANRIHECGDLGAALGNRIRLEIGRRLGQNTEADAT